MNRQSALTVAGFTTSRNKIALCVLLLLPMVALPQSSVELPAGPTVLQGSALRGEDLFTGKTAFRNRGPACIACHSISGFSFPNGGTLGPDLTHTYTKLGPQGTEAAMQTLFFPAMAPIYNQHQLIPQEQADMVAFFKQTSADKQPPAQGVTPILILVAFLLGIVFVALTAFFWRKRVLSVRRALVARATGQGARS